MSWVDWIVNVPLLEGVYRVSRTTSEKVSGFTSGAAFQDPDNRPWWIAGGIAAALGVVAVAALVSDNPVEEYKRLTEEERELQRARSLAYDANDREALGALQGQLAEVVSRKQRIAPLAAEGLVKSQLDDAFKAAKGAGPAERQRLGGMVSLLEGQLAELRKQSKKKSALDDDLEKMEKGIKSEENRIRLILKEELARAQSRGSAKDIATIEEKMREQAERISDREARLAASYARAIEGGGEQESVARIEVGSHRGAVLLAEYELARSAKETELAGLRAEYESKRLARVEGLGAAAAPCGPDFFRTQGVAEQEAAIAEAKASLESQRKSQEQLDALRAQENRIKFAMDQWEERVKRAEAQGRRPPPEPVFESLGMTVEEAIAQSNERLAAAEVARQESEKAARDPERRLLIAAQTSPTFTEADVARLRGRGTVSEPCLASLEAAILERKIQARVLARKSLRERGGTGVQRMKGTTSGHLHAAEEAIVAARAASRAEVREREEAERKMKQSFGVGTWAQKTTAPVEVVVVRRRGG